MTAPITLPRLDPATLAQLPQRYEETPNMESLTRYQMILLTQQDYKVPQIARIVLRSEDTVARVINRFLAGGLNAVPRRQSQDAYGSRVLARARAGLTELSDQLSLVYTPAYDPDANRIEWLWRISRRIVTHNHHRKDFEALLGSCPNAL